MMKIRPLGNRILVEIVKFENKTKSGLILFDDNKIAENFAKVLEVSDKVTDISVNEYVIFDIDASMEVRNGDEIKYIVNLEDVYAKVDFKNE
ncbi:co-chaperone GroES family protein [Pseudostreptobacillus hongkongensis]|uniref:co-chaperone GroES family protein n=1 Tax=Pseudostreptobacillus hongkongensis TaxID=1162717 RepID=UPI0009E77FC9|nr:hypothetical protein [Pseudostreptobacillus hongkongensis]